MSNNQFVTFARIVLFGVSLNSFLKLFDFEIKQDNRKQVLSVSSKTKLNQVIFKKAKMT